MRTNSWVYVFGIVWLHVQGLSRDYKTTDGVRMLLCLFVCVNVCVSLSMCVRVHARGIVRVALYVRYVCVCVCACAAL